jgi:hypothetical protein
VDSADRGTTWDGFCESIARLPVGQLWRHNQVGDLPGENNTVNGSLLGQLAKANTGRNGFTYTHKPVLERQDGPTKSNREAISDNYRIMQLASPQVSYQVKSHMNETLDTFEPLLNQLEFKKMSIQDGFGTADHSLLITTMKRFVANGTI